MPTKDIVWNISFVVGRKVLVICIIISLLGWMCEWQRDPPLVNCIACLATMVFLLGSIQSVCLVGSLVSDNLLSTQANVWHHIPVSAAVAGSYWLNYVIGPKCELLFHWFTTEELNLVNKEYSEEK